MYPLIPVLGKEKQDGLTFKAILGYFGVWGQSRVLIPLLEYKEQREGGREAEK